MRTIVVVGASLAGLRTAQALRKRGFDGKLELVGEESHAPYDRPPLSKQLLSGEWAAEKLFFSAKENHSVLNLTLSLGRRATSLDVRAREITLDDGSRRPYDGLVIATGAAPRKLPGQETWNEVYTLRTLDEALEIRAQLLRSPRVLVVGAGFIGLEVAASCRKLGLAVTLVEPQTLPLLGLLGPRVGESVRQLHADHGVELRLGVGVAGFEGAGRVERALLTDGSRVETDLVVVGIGVVPSTDWLAGSGIAVDRGVLCDATCATNVPGIVAAGDVARWPHAWFDELVRIEHWSNAVEMAHAAALSLLEPGAAAAYAPLPYFWSDQYDVKFQFAGRVRVDDELDVAQGQLGAAQYVALFGREGRLTGVLSSNRPAQFMRCRRLLSERGSLADARALL